VSWYLVLLLVPVGIGAYLVWDHRRREEDRARVSAERLSSILGAKDYIPQPEPATRPEDVVKVEPVSGASIAPAAPVYSTRERVLSPPETLLYLLLKTGLPDYHVFAHVALRAVLDAAPAVTGSARNEHMRRLSVHAVDFLVCDRALKPIAVVEFARHGEPDGTAGSRESWIGSAGLRYLSFEPAALPRKEALRAMVLGEAALQKKESAAKSA
jgi:hypothetical protein